jgi:hypothetical protein
MPGTGLAMATGAADARASPGQDEVFPGAAPGDRKRVGQRVRDQPLLLKPRQRGVDGTNGNLSTGPSGDLLPDRDPVPVGVEMGQRQHHVDLEFAKEIAFGHISSTNA